MNELFEKELRNTSINDKSLADYVIENYVPMSVIKGIKAEIKELPYQRIFGNVSSYSLLDTVLEIIDKHIERSKE